MITVDPILFPLSVERCVSGVQYKTTLTELGNGSEVAVVEWEDARIKFNASLGIRSLTDLRACRSFFMRRKGRGRGFLVRDLLDYEVARGAEGAFGVGGGGVQVFQLTKTYADAYNSEVRPIKRPEQGSVKIYRDGLLLVENTHYTLDYNNGLLYLYAAPAPGAVLEWEGRFYVPVRFDVDEFEPDEFIAHMEWDAAKSEMFVKGGSADLPRLPMIEVR